MSNNSWNVVVVGGGAAGFFSAIRLKELNPSVSVLLVEKTQKLLSKVRISGGGRCNVTHHCLKNSVLLDNYPRGKKIIKQAVNKFNVEKVIHWFQSHGVSLKVEEDGRMFPTTDSSETIASLFENLALKFQIKILRGCQIHGIENETEDGTASWRLTSNQGDFYAQKIILATGGNVSWTHYQWLDPLPISMIKPYPSLFTFKIEEDTLKSLSGVSVENGSVKLIGFEPSFSGPILITHWGLSGPAVLKASAWAAQWIFEKSYEFQILVSWVSEEENQYRTWFYEQVQLHAKKKISNFPTDIPQRLWIYILEKSEVNPDKTLGELTKQQKNKLVEMMVKMPFSVKGKTTFKEEFVTAGGISEASLNTNTLELKNCPGIYACGELLDVDGITGGFNFQAAWSTSNLIAESIAYSPFSENL